MITVTLPAPRLPPTLLCLRAPIALGVLTWLALGFVACVPETDGNSRTNGTYGAEEEASAPTSSPPVQAGRSAPPSTETEQPGDADVFGSGLTDIDGLLVGHHTLTERPTGCSVVLVPDGAAAGVEQRGGAPGSRELGLLDPVNTVQAIHGIVLSGGSAFGLDAASGAVRYLEEQGIGYDVRVAKVPIVPSAILFDLAVGNKPQIRPDSECGYLAAKAATGAPAASGSVGAGAGATVGKLGGVGSAMKGGIGNASITTTDGLTVAAMVAVNAVGDIVDPATGSVIAGVRTADGQQLADARKLLMDGPFNQPQAPNENTTIGVVATNAPLTKVQATKLAQMGDDGLARTIYPAHTPSDGDTLFAIATGTWEGKSDLRRIGALGAMVVAEAVLRAVESAHGIEGFPSSEDLGTRRSDR